MDDSTFGHRLRQARLLRGYTHKELGARVGVDEAHLSRYECGKSTPRLPVLAKLVCALSVSADYLLGTSASQQDPLTQCLAHLSEQDQVLARGVLELLAKRQVGALRR